MSTRPYLSDADADAVLGLARKAAEEAGVPMTIAVVDEGCHLLRLVRMDGALLISLEVGIGKARTAAKMRMSTSDLAGLVAKSAAALALPEAIPFPGGEALIRDGRCVGGIGVSGGTPDDDERIARLAAAALG